MTFEFRDSLNYMFGTLTNPAAVSDTTLSSQAFVSLPTNYSALDNGRYLPLVLHDPSAGMYEIVWVTGHAADAQTVTVVRGREGTSPQAWSAGTQVTVAPTVRDTNPIATVATLPTNPHLGMRVAQTDTGVVVERTKTAGWMPSVGACRAQDLATSGSVGSVPPAADATVTIRAGMAGGVTTNADGVAVGTFPTPFPNGCSGAVVCSAHNTARSVVINSVSKTGLTVIIYNAGMTHLANTTTSFSYIAFGW